MPMRVGTQQRGAAVGHQADVDEREQEVGALRGEDQVAAQRQRAADADGRAVDAATTGFGISRIACMIGW